MLTTSILSKQIEQYFLPELELFNQSTIFIPLGQKVEDALNFAAKVGAIHPQQIISGLPHPSGANAERIAYFLNEKASDKLSAKTNAQKIDSARESIMNKVANL